MEPLISVIVPIYKVEKYLHQCVDSIINQTYKNLEIILVDDGSPDNCGAICDEYAKKDARVKVIHKENGGLSDARNCGLKAMLGDYIVFVDSDDYMVEDGIEHMLNLSIKHNADLIIGGTQKIDEVTGNIIWSTIVEGEKITVMDKQEAMKEHFQKGCAAWARLYKKEIHNGIEFPVDEINEDEAIVLKILERCNCVVQTSHIVYNYIYHENSITSTSFHTGKLLWCKHCEDNLKYVEEKYPNLVPYAKERYCSSLIWALNNMTADTAKFKKEIKEYRSIMSKNYKEYKKIRMNNMKENIRSFMLVYCYDLYATIVRLLGKHYT